MMSEAEAKGKWCPQARAMLASRKDNDLKNSLHVADAPVWNRIIDQTPKNPRDFHVKCIGSSCMAWRWSEKSALEVPMVGEVQDRKGYCGAYGKPDYGERDE